MSERIEPMAIQDPFLRASIQNGYAPLTVGFVLEGNLASIETLKIWHFGERNPSLDTEVVNDFVVNGHLYGHANPAGYTVWVDIVQMGNDGKYHVIKSSNAITINVTQGPPDFGLSQTQGILYEGDSAGFSLHISVPGTSKIQWNFGDENIPPPQGRRRQVDQDLYPMNPFHTYNKASEQSYQGTVTITWYDNTGEKHQPTWPFAILVLPNSLRNVTGYIEFHSFSCDPPSVSCDMVKTGVEVNMYGEVHGGTSGFTHKWDFGDGHGDEKSPTTWTYAVGQKNYSVTDKATGIIDTPTGSKSITITLQKSIAVRDKLQKE